MLCKNCGKEIENNEYCPYCQFENSYVHADIPAHLQSIFDLMNHQIVHPSAETMHPDTEEEMPEMEAEAAETVNETEAVTEVTSVDDAEGMPVGAGDGEEFWEKYGSNRDEDVSEPQEQTVDPAVKAENRAGLLAVAACLIVGIAIGIVLAL